MAIDALARLGTDGPTPPWLEASAFHAPGVRITEVEQTMRWTREGEVRAFGLQDGMPVEWSFLRDRAHLAGARFRPSWTTHQWQRYVASADTWWAEAKDRALWEDARTQLIALLVVQNARLALAPEVDWENRTTPVVREVAEAYCDWPAIRARTRDAAIVAGKAGPQTDASVEAAVDGVMPYVAAPLFTGEVPSRPELIPDLGAGMRPARTLLLGAIREVLAQQVRAAWPAR
jgi:hypothetical protein